MSTTITITHLKNIRSLEYEIPYCPGVYVITGLNGCGKTSLLVAIHRITHGNAFKENYLQVAEVWTVMQTLRLSIVLVVIM